VTRAGARELADLFALVEAVLEDLVRLELDGERLVDFPPEELVALDAGGVAGFGEAVRHGSESGSGVGHCNGGTLQIIATRCVRFVRLI